LNSLSISSTLNRRWGIHLTTWIVKGGPSRGVNPGSFILYFLHCDAELSYSGPLTTTTTPPPHHVWDIFPKVEIFVTYFKSLCNVCIWMK
jgi:hypothetical protein